MGFLKRPKAPKPSAQELAGVERQSRMLDEETGDIEKRLKAISRGRLGSKSLLASASSNTASSTASKGGGSFLSGSTGTFGSGLTRASASGIHGVNKKK